MFLVKYTVSGVSYASQRVVHRFKPVDDTSGEESVQGKIVVVTGANAGLGQIVATQMAKRNAIVILACRDLVKAERVMADIKISVPTATLFLVKLDLGDLESVRSCAREIMDKFPHVNILINNAGYMGTQAVIERTKDGFEKNMGTNHLGHFLFTLLLLKHLQKGSPPSRIVTVGSLAHENANLDLEDLNMDKEDQSVGFLNMRPYNNSKLCNMLFAKELARRLEGQAIRSYTICPGIVNTGLFDNSPWYVKYTNLGVLKVFGCTPEQGAETILHCALASELTNETGKPYRFRRYWKESDDRLNGMPQVAKKVWQLSEQLVGLEMSQAL